MTLSIETVLNHYDQDGRINWARVNDYKWCPVNCPFHDDRHASASVNLEKNAFACHACGMSGDAVKIIERMEDLDFGGAIEWARELFGESVGDVREPTAKSKARKRPAWRDRLFD